jgi:hypothetical protein
MNKTLLSVFIIIITLIALLLFMNVTKEGLKNRIKNIRLTKKTTKCDKVGCPLASVQNAIYKTHVEYKPIRDKNHMIAHNTQTGNFLFKTKGPANIFIIRHGEKIKSKNALDCNGILRSTYIPDLITHINKNGFGIHSIITAYDYRSMHQEQTISISSWLMDIPVYMYGQASDPDKAINTVFTEPFFSGKTVLFCWEHQCIQGLVNSIITLGAKLKGLNNYKFKNTDGNSLLPSWDTNNYKSILYFDTNLNYSVYEEKFTSCFKLENDLLTYTTQVQHCQ